MKDRTKHRMAVVAIVSALCVCVGPVLALVNVELNGVTATTSTSATGVATGSARYVIVQVWQAPTFSGTSTVLVEEQASNLTAAVAPWVTVATFANCDTSGLGTVTVGGVSSAGPCKIQTLTPAARTRLRVSACTSCKILGVVQDVR